jgi:deoxyguanosine kinase
MELDRCRYIVVEGPIGAGKTTLARELAIRLHGETLFEQPDENPFLARFYDDMARFALPTQLTFLFQRADQLRGLAQLDFFRRPTVADFLLDKDPLFARLNLSDDEYALYEKVYAHLKPQTPTPDLVVYLQAPVTTLIERVHRRGVDFERAIPADYLARLADAYTRYFYRYEDAPLLIVNSERLNFVDNPRHVDLLLERMIGMRGQREFFNLGSS